MRHIPGPAILPAAVLAATLAIAVAGPAAASADLDWQVSLSGAVALTEVRFGRTEGWTCTTGSLTATAIAVGVGSALMVQASWVGLLSTTPAVVVGFASTVVGTEASDLDEHRPIRAEPKDSVAQTRCLPSR